VSTFASMMAYQPYFPETGTEIGSQVPAFSLYFPTLENCLFNVDMGNFSNR
jgi:hypothetical protein